MGVCLMGIIRDIDDEIIHEAQHGNSEAMAQIFEEYENFVFLKAKNYFLMGADKEDLILDDDGNGIIFLDGQQISGGTRTEDEPENIYHGDGNEYVLNGSTLIINGGLRIENYSKDQLGIHLDIKEEEEEEEEDEKPDFALAENKTSPLVIDLDGDGVETTSINDVYFDHNNDGLREKTAWVKSDDEIGRAHV